MVRGLMNDHNLQDWVLAFDRAKRRAGITRYEVKTIGLSAPLTHLRTQENVRNTGLHEIAHALVGHAAGHGPVWKAKAIEIGCNGKRCSSGAGLPRQWEGTCPSGHVFRRHRKPSGDLSCDSCSGGVFDARFAISWRVNPVLETITDGMNVPSSRLAVCSTHFEQLSMAGTCSQCE